MPEAQVGSIPDRANDATPYWQAFFDGLLDKMGRTADPKGTRNYLPLLLGIMSDPKGDFGRTGLAGSVLNQMLGDQGAINGPARDRDEVGDAYPIPHGWPRVNRIWRGGASDIPGFYEGTTRSMPIPTKPTNMMNYDDIRRVLLEGMAGERN